MKRFSELDIVQLFREGDRETLRVAALTIGAVCIAASIFALLLNNMDHLAMLRGNHVACSRTDNVFLLCIIALLFVFFLSLVFAIGYCIQYANWQRFIKKKFSAARHMVSNAKPMIISCGTSAICGTALAIVVMRC